MSKLRDDIKKYETERGIKVKSFGIVRCLYCPISALNCPRARHLMK